MSTSPECGSPELGLDLDLHFLPAWAQQPAENKYAKFEGGEERFDRSRSDRGPRRDRRPDRAPRRPDGRPSGPGPNRGRGYENRRPERLEPLPPPLDI